MIILSVLNKLHKHHFFPFLLVISSTCVDEGSWVTIFHGILWAAPLLLYSQQTHVDCSLCAQNHVGAGEPVQTRPRTPLLNGAYILLCVRVNVWWGGVGANKPKNIHTDRQTRVSRDESYNWLQLSMILFPKGTKWWGPQDHARDTLSCSGTENAYMPLKTEVAT